MPKRLKQTACCLCAVLLCFALTACQVPVSSQETEPPAGSAAVTPTDSAPQATNAPEPEPDLLARLPLPDGYVPLAPPAVSGITEKDITHIEYQDMAFSIGGTALFDAEQAALRLWPDKEYTSQEYGKYNGSYEYTQGGVVSALHYDKTSMWYYADLDAQRDQRITKSIDDLGRQAYEAALRVLGSEEYLKHPQVIDAFYETKYYLNTNSVTTWFPFYWDMVVDGMTVYGRQVSADAFEDGIAYVSANWADLAPTQKQLPEVLLSMEDALYSLNYVRSQTHAESDLVSANEVLKAQLVLTPDFSDRTDLYTPAWEFTLLVKGDYGDFIRTEYVDIQTGRVYSAMYSGKKATAFPGLYSTPEFEAGGLTSAQAQQMLEDFALTLWNSLYTMEAPVRPEYVLENSQNMFNLWWADYRIALIRQKYPLEQLKSPPRVEVTVSEMGISSNGNVTAWYSMDLYLDRDEGDGYVYLYSGASFVLRDGQWMIRDAGTSWNGDLYRNAYYSVWHNSALDQAREKVDERIEKIKVEEETYTDDAEAPEGDAGG